MTRIYRISKGPGVGDLLASVEAIQTFARDHGPRRYDVDEHSLRPCPGTKVSAPEKGWVGPPNRLPDPARLVISDAYISKGLAFRGVYPIP
jgi:hypothetical protein